MEDKKLSEKESLELISQMIQHTQYRVAKNAGIPFLIWGYMSIVLSLVIWFFLKETGNPNWNLLWFLLPAVAFPVTLRAKRQDEQLVKTYIDRIVGYVWTVFGVAGFFISCVSMFFWHIPILFIILLMMGMGTTLTGLIVKIKSVIWGGVTGTALSVGCLVIEGINQLPFFAFVFICMMVIPGHDLNRIASKMKRV